MAWGGKNRPDFRHMFFQRQEAGSGHPFMKLGHGGQVMRTDTDIVIRLDHFATGHAEHEGFHIIFPSGNGIDAERFPQAIEKLVFVILLAEGNKNDQGIAWNPPSAETAGNIPANCRISNRIPARIARFFEIDIGFEIRPRRI